MLYFNYYCGKSTHTHVPHCRISKHFQFIVISWVLILNANGQPIARASESVKSHVLALWSQ